MGAYDEYYNAMGYKDDEVDKLKDEVIAGQQEYIDNLKDNEKLSKRIMVDTIKIQHDILTKCARFLEIEKVRLDNVAPNPVMWELHDTLTGINNKVTQVLELLED